MRKLFGSSILVLLTAILMAVSGPAAAGQYKAGFPALRESSLSPRDPRPPRDERSREPSERSFESAPQDKFERSIKTDPAVNLYLGCVKEGAIKVNGWNRNEVRVFIAHGSKFAFRVAEKHPKSGQPVWIKVVRSEAARFGPDGDCLSAEEIEIDAPVSATITIKGREISTTVDTLKKVDITSIGGSIIARNITNGVAASAGQGDITVEASQGPMQLDTTTGNVVVFEAGPSDFGDMFHAKTNSGSVMLQRLGFRQVNVGSATGSVGYSGEIISGGTYNLRTSRGTIRMTVPIKASFRLWATYGFGTFSSEIPVDILTENLKGPNRDAGPVKSIVGKAGTGDATVKLTASNGNIEIRKL